MTIKDEPLHKKIPNTVICGKYQIIYYIIAVCSEHGLEIAHEVIDSQHEVTLTVNKTLSTSILMLDLNSEQHRVVSNIE